MVVVFWVRMQNSLFQDKERPFRAQDFAAPAVSRHEKGSPASEAAQNEGTESIYAAGLRGPGLTAEDLPFAPGRGLGGVGLAADGSSAFSMVNKKGSGV